MAGRFSSHPRTTRSRDERGLSESVQWAALTPLLLLVILGFVQAGVRLHGQQTAHEAAAAGADRACVVDGSSSDAQSTAGRVAAAGGLTGVSVTVNRTSTWVVVTVEGQAPTFLDVGQGHVREQVAMPVEQVTNP